MAARKPDSEVGPLGVWAYNTRVLLELSDEQAGRAAKVTKATIRKIEGGSTKNPSARLLHDLYKFYKAEGERLDRPVEEPPGYRSAPVADPADVAQAIRDQTVVLTRLAAALETRETNQRAWEQQLIRALRIEMGEHRVQGEEVLERLGELAASLGLEGTPNGGERDMPGHEG